jgi:hypothetical protein
MYTFMDSGKRSWSGKGSRQSGSGGGQQRVQSSRDTPEAETEDEETSDEDVTLAFVPNVNEENTYGHPITFAHAYLSIRNIIR